MRCFIVVLAIASLVLVGGCGPRSRVAARGPEGRGAKATIVVHSRVATPAEVTMREGVAIVGDEAAPGGWVRRLPPLVRVDEFPVALECPLRTVCVVLVRKRARALVFAFEPRVEIDLEVPATPGPAIVRYRDPRSESAALGRVLAHASAMHRACVGSQTDGIARERRALESIARRDRRATVRSSALLALMTERCGTAKDVALARAVVADVDPTAPALGLWTLGLLRASDELDSPANATAKIEAAIDRHPDADVGALLLAVLAIRAEDHGDTEAQQRYDARLQAPPFAATATGWSRLVAQEMKHPLRVAVGDAMPSLVLPRLEHGDPVATDALRGAPQLYYFSASWCRGCVESLPKLRRFAADHPDVKIVYVLWDDLDDATEFVLEHGPVPGTVVRPDRTTRKSIEKSVFKLVVLPTFVLADGDGRVLATSVEQTIDGLAETLARPAG